MAAEGAIATILFYSVDAVMSMACAIREAAQTVRRNKEECEDIAQCVASVSAVLNGLHQSNKVPPAMRGALDDLAASLRRALDLVTECQEKRALPRFLGAKDMARELRRVQDDITRKVTLGSFAANVHTSITLTNMQQYAAPPAPAPAPASSPPPSPMWYVAAPAAQPVPWTTSPAPVSVSQVMVSSSPWQQKTPPSMADFCCPSNWS